MKQTISSWSGTCRTVTDLVPSQEFSYPQSGPFIARGGGKSFGDAAFLSHGSTLLTTANQRVDPVDQTNGTVTCEAGVSMGALHRCLESQGYYLDVFGGTQFATAGGAVASDIHGKNDPTAGSCGNHVQALRLRCPGGELWHLSAQENADLFSATIGGIGLTGTIESITFRVSPREPRRVLIRGKRVRSMQEMLDCFENLPCDHHVGDWLLPADHLNTGFFWYASEEPGPAAEPGTGSKLWLPQIKLLNRFSVGLNSRLLTLVADRVKVVKHLRAFNYGGVHQTLIHWNRLFGPNGFCEYHWVVTGDRFLEVHAKLVGLARTMKVSPMYGVVKKFGSLKREGLLSFPSPGYSFSFQMEDRPEHRTFMNRFTDLLLDYQGHVYLSKDAVLNKRQAAAMFPQLDGWRQIVAKVDPKGRVASDLSRRLGLKD